MPHFQNQQTKTPELTHFDANGQAQMVDVGDKNITHRKATAQGLITMQAQTLEIIRKGEAKKGDVLGVARIAGILAAKKTSDFIPLCHPLALTHIAIQFELREASDESLDCVTCQATVETKGQTGVEMEALMAVQIALLTIYDMCKAVDRAMCIKNVCLIEKHGGKSDWRLIDH